MNNLEQTLRDELGAEIPGSLDASIEAMIRGAQLSPTSPGHWRRVRVPLMVAAVVVGFLAAWWPRGSVPRATVVFVVEPGPALRQALTVTETRQRGTPLARQWQSVTIEFLAGSEALSKQRGDAT